MTDFRLGLRVEDVRAAAAFYAGLGFEEEASVPGADGEALLIVLRRGAVRLIVDSLVGMPFPDSERERDTQRGPRGLGVVIGLGTTDLDATYAYCTRAGCTITCEPMDEAWGERVFTCLDPFGYEWEFAAPLADLSAAEATAAVREQWLGGT